MTEQDKTSKTQEKTEETNDWKEKFNDLLNTCQTELKKTTQIGMKMLSASQSNAKLHETYESLGVWLIKAIDSGDITIQNQKITDLIEEAKKLEKDLETYESDVRNIKKG